MCRITKCAFGAILSAIVLSTAVFAAVTPSTLSKYGQQTRKVYSTTTAPTIDGKVTAGEYGDALAVYNDFEGNAYWTGDESAFDSATLDDLIPDDMTLYMTYDDTYLYLALTAKDVSHYTPLPGTQVWDGDMLSFNVFLPTNEFDYSDSTHFCLGLCSTDGITTAYYEKAASYAEMPFKLNTAIQDASHHLVTAENGLTTYEAKLTWKELVGTDGAPDSLLGNIRLFCSTKGLPGDYDGGFQGSVRMAQRFTEKQVEELKKEGVEATYAPEILKFVGAPASVDTPTVSDTSASSAGAPQTADLASAAIFTSILALGTAVVISRKR